MSSARPIKTVASIGVLAGLALTTGGVIAGGLALQGSAVQSTFSASADIPLANGDLAPDDIVSVTPASRGSARAALLDGIGATLTVAVDGESIEITTAAPTLADALAEAGITLGWDDVVSADLSAAPVNGTEVTISRAATEYVTEPVAVEHPVEERTTDELLVGESRLVQEGVDGEAQVTSEVQLLDGEEVSRSTVLTTQVIEAVPEIVEVGTKEPASATSPQLYTLRQFMSAGVVNWGGYRFTYYSQSVLPGGGLNIPGRHVNEDGYVSDGDGYIVLANSAPKGTIIDTPFGYQGKVYDRGTVGNHYDVYTQ